MDIRPMPEARRRADRQMGIQVRALNDKATEQFDLAHAEINHVATRYARLEARARRAMIKN
jgi:hypothetical protein